MKATAPITGGTSMPPVEARASMEDATMGRYPALFMRGMVMTPTAVTLATWLPVIIPNIQLPRTAAFAGPPRYLPKSARPRSMKRGPAPEIMRKAPNMIKTMITVDETPRGEPRMPSALKNVKLITCSKVNPVWARKEGRCVPTARYRKPTRQMITIDQPMTRLVASSTSTMAMKLHNESRKLGMPVRKLSASNSMKT